MVYNIFGFMNITLLTPEEKLSRIFRAIGSPARIQILAAIGRGEACVCHLEAVLGLRQAYISQQLMEMRDAELLETRRDGRYIFYRLSRPQLLDNLIEISGLFGIPPDVMAGLIDTDRLPGCCCPNCADQSSPPVASDNE
jgi:ArsR family transcriptional regulator